MSHEPNLDRKVDVPFFPVEEGLNDVEGFEAFARGDGELADPLAEETVDGKGTSDVAHHPRMPREVQPRIEPIHIRNYSLTEQPEEEQDLEHKVVEKMGRAGGGSGCDFLGTIAKTFLARVRWGTHTNL